MSQSLLTLFPQVAPVVWWLLAATLVLIGLVGTVLPLLPGTAFVLAGLVLAAWIDGFARVGPLAITLIAIFALLAWVTDYVAAIMGARQVGASREALVGAAIGTLLGIFTGFVGLLFMPFVGAVAGEWYAQHRKGAAASPNAEQQAVKVGIATWLGLLAGIVVKLMLVLAMILTFVLAWIAS
ncbi:DUF456 domain-containing protein [Rivibacter subsaxonicus]|uniref:DUF456 domain-containing protein n=1 Tax=Rivibacter subsaxonicus TaxID=457575 RepID=A0A4Q7VWA1_9BURK|nr:DUF456 family protein [Rivibacter subsaxonicus]RZU00718.1 hypothetical protein EV670_1430 [Rivibacter subsaxonicus]